MLTWSLGRPLKRKKTQVDGTRDMPDASARGQSVFHALQEMDQEYAWDFCQEP